MKIGSTPGDILYGEVLTHYRDNEFQIQITHVSVKNGSSYNDKETIAIQGDKIKSPKKLIRNYVKCEIRYRDQYNRLLCDVEECQIVIKEITTIKIKRNKKSKK